MKVQSIVRLAVVGLGFSFTAATVSTVRAADDKAANASSLIARDVLFGNPDRAAVRLSDDGKYISFLAPVDGVMNVWVGPANDWKAAKPITKDTKRGIRIYQWAYTNQHILYSMDEGGNENWNIHSVDVTSGEDKNLINNKKVAARINQASRDFPDEILVGINDRDPRLHDLHRINIRTGEDKLVLENPGEIEGNPVAGFGSNDKFIVNFAMTVSPDGGGVVYKSTQPIDVSKTTDPAKDSKWQEFSRAPMEDALTTGLVGEDHSGNVLYVQDSRGRDTSALYQWDLTGKEKKLIAEDPKADFSGMLVDPKTELVQAVAFNYDRVRWQVIDQSIAPDLNYLKTVADGEITVGTRTADDKHWVVAYMLDNGPVRYYVYDRDNKKADFLFTNRAAWENLKFAKMKPTVVDARDGLKLVCYVTLPVDADPDGDGVPNKPLPMVLDVHGGPWARDTWGMNPEHQWLANRGYAVMSVNYRGSTGFGKNFINASNHEWAGKMHDDLLDAVDYAVKNKIADKDKVAIMGGSYGGYATLVGLTFTPDVFACGVDIVGPSNLYTLLKSVPPYWKPAVAQWRNRVADETSAAGKQELEKRSPLTRVDQIKKPLLIGQGANDPRVHQAEADQIVKAMQEKNIPVTYVLYPDEGHGFARPPNRISFFAVTEAFLAKHLGGNFEPIGDDFKGSTIQVKTGDEGVPGLAEIDKNK